jgi:dTDP-4-dehydrorhamnose 3,5-epimerase
MTMGQFSFEPLPIPAVGLIRARKLTDPRGTFAELYTVAGFEQIGIRCRFIQDNEARSRKAGTVRGLHFQTPPAAQSKLVYVVRGAIFDVCVDLRRGSPTFGRWCGVRLAEGSGDQVFVPTGFAHGYCTLEDDTAVIYKVDAPYSADHDAGVRWDDPDIAIEWPVEPGKLTVSDKDARLPMLRDISSPFLQA